MKSEADYAAALAEVCKQWNKAEVAVKLAEQVNEKIVNPAIYELRYAGRRIVEASQSKDKGDLDAACQKLADAHFDCCRAQHDAIDAATSKIAKSFSAAIDKLSPSTVVGLYPKYPQTFAQLNAIRKKISNSRENRDCRDTVYDAIADVDLPALVDQFNEFVSCEPLMKRQTQFNRGSVVVGALIALLVGVMGTLIATKLLTPVGAEAEKPAAKITSGSDL